MFSIFLILLSGIFSDAHAFSYPENLYAFELVPNAVQYFVSSSKNKIKIQRTLDIKNQGFFIDVKIVLTMNKQNYPYELRMQVSETGEIFLRDFGNKTYNYHYLEERKLILSSLSIPRKPFKTDIGDQITLSYDPKHDTKNTITTDLTFGEHPIRIVFASGAGIMHIISGSEKFSQTTLRIYDSLK
ncbi:MAG: hypothetical protein ACRCTJ_03190 [Brevinema sp.]